MNTGKKMMKLSEILGKKIWKEVIRESGVLASQRLEVPTLRELAGPPKPTTSIDEPRWRLESKTRNGDIVRQLSPSTRGRGGRAGPGQGGAGRADEGLRGAAGLALHCGAARCRPAPPHLRAASPQPARGAAGAAPPAWGGHGERHRLRLRGRDRRRCCCCCWRPRWRLRAAPRRGPAGGGGPPAWARCCGRWRR